MTRADFEGLRVHLRTLRDLLPELYQEVMASPFPQTVSLDQDAGPLAGATLSWYQRLTRNVLPAIDFDLPVLLVAICGGGSTGKSTLFNLLAGEKLSRVGFRAGLTRRVLLAGHPRVLSGGDVAQALLHRLERQPEPWRAALDTTSPGPPLYAATEDVPPHLLLIDTPDFDTGEEGELRNRARAEAVLRTADVIIYVFTNTVYNNLSNTQFMSEIVGGIGGRPTVLVYRISRAASDAEVLEHCQVVARRLYGEDDRARGFPPQVVGVYRVHESDSVAEGRAEPALIPLGPSRRGTHGQSLPALLAGLDVAAIKRHVFSADLRAIHRGASETLGAIRAQQAQLRLYEVGLQSAMGQHALEALRTFPADEAVAVTTRLFIESSPSVVRALRLTGRIISAPLRGMVALGRRIAVWTGGTPPGSARQEGERLLEVDLLTAANRLRNRLLDDHLIVQVAGRDPLLLQARAAAAGSGTKAAVTIEALGRELYNLHIPVPDSIQRQEERFLAQDWDDVTAALRAVAARLFGLPADLEDDLSRSVQAFREQMKWYERLRETFFASLTALPPLLGVTYTLLTADPVSGTGLWIQLQSLFGLNDLWALVSIPASVGLDEGDRKQLERMLAPVFRLWFERRIAQVVDAFKRTVCRPAFDVLKGVPSQDDRRMRAVERALADLEVEP